MNISPQLTDYELIDTGDFEKLERFGDHILRRPEPQAIWRKSLPEEEWRRLADASFMRRAGAGGNAHDERGEWIFSPKMAQRWMFRHNYGDMHIAMTLAPTAFKHIGVFSQR